MVKGFFRKLGWLLGYYDTGNLAEAEEELNALMLETRDVPGEALLLQAVLGWIRWKAKRREEAAALWDQVYASEADNASARLYAAAGLAIYFAEEGKQEDADQYIRVTMDRANGHRDLMAVIVMNSMLKALADLRRYKEAAGIFHRAVAICTLLENCLDPGLVRQAKHQRAKLGFNWATRVLIPCRRYAQAEEELRQEVCERYLDGVGENNDFAACCHWISVLALRRGEWFEALLQEERSLEIWIKLRESFPGRMETSVHNLRLIFRKKYPRQDVEINLLETVQAIRRKVVTGNDKEKISGQY